MDTIEIVNGCRVGDGEPASSTNLRNHRYRPANEADWQTARVRRSARFETRKLRVCSREKKRVPLAGRVGSIRPAKCTGGTIARAMCATVPPGSRGGPYRFAWKST